MATNGVFCSICGCGIYEDFNILSRKISSEPSPTFISPLADYHQHRALFEGSGSGWQVYEPNLDYDTAIPIHSTCLQVVKQFIDHRSKNKDRPSSALLSLDSFYESLLQQASRNEKELGLQLAVNGLEWDHQYYGARQFWGQEFWIPDFQWQWLVADPIDIPSPTTYLLSRLQPQPARNPARCSVSSSSNFLSSATSSSPAQSTRLHDLPAEILDYIKSYLSPSSTKNLRLSCQDLAHRLPLDQLYWYNQLTSGALFGYLWDLDPEQLRLKNRESPSWDWAHLVRTLSREESFRKGGVLNRAPVGLKNRRRLWKILEHIEWLDEHVPLSQVEALWPSLGAWRNPAVEQQCKAESWDGGVEQGGILEARRDVVAVF